MVLRPSYQMGVAALKRIMVAAAAIAILVSACAHRSQQSDALWVGLDHPDGSGIARLGVVSTPYTQGGPSATATLPAGSGAKTQQGRVVCGVLIRAWSEADGARVQLYALVPRNEVPNEFTSNPSDLREEEFASYHLRPGESVPIEEMSAFGTQPLHLSCFRGATR